MSKLSLKDRLNTKPTNQITPENEVKKERYEVNSMGVIDTLIADDNINSINVYGTNCIYINKNGKTSKVTSNYQDELQIETLVKIFAANEGTNADENKIVSFSHREGINTTAVFPPISTPISLIIKCYRDKFANIHTLVENSAFSKEIGLFLELLCSLNLNVLITGESNTLKTTVLSALSKKIPQNDRGVMLDFSNEIKSELPNIVNYNFSKTKSQELLDTIFSSVPDKIYANDPDFSLISKHLKNGYKGIFATLKSKSAKDAMEKINDIKDCFDVVIATSRESGRKIKAIYENYKILNEIFTTSNNGEFLSCGYIPEFYSSVDKNLTPLNLNIFDINYKHTTTKTQLPEQSIEKPNVDILRKLKKKITPDDVE